ncbi:MAG TPA: hypothetical protein DC058_06330 [Planctomycetaceae bacterium]|nr:hypothetical protein [Planctomycetaceae bacterium]
MIKSEGPEQLDQMPSIGIADSAAVIDGQTAAKVFHFPGVGVCGEQLSDKETAGCWFQSTDFDSRHIVDWFAGERLLAQFAEHVMQSDGPGKDHAETGIFLTCRSEAIEEQQSIAGTAISGKSLQHVREFIQQEQQFAMR